jgi:SnoaL-like domain
VPMVTAEWQGDASDDNFAHHLARVVVSALPDHAGPEDAPRLVATGRSAVLAALARDRHQYRRRAEVLRCTDATNIVIEFVEHGVDDQLRSAVLALVTAGASIVGVLEFRHEHVALPSNRTPGPVESAAAEQSVMRYLTELEAGRGDQAAARFSKDAIYSVPPREPGGLRGTVRGRDAIAGVFAARGVTSARHHIGRTVASDAFADVVVLGRVTGLPSGRSATFASCVSFDPAGLISRYVAQICIPEAFG